MSTAIQYRYILVTRKTRLQELIERFNTWPQAKFYLEHNNVDTEDYLVEHDLYQYRIAEAEKTLKARGRFQSLERSFLPSYQFAQSDIIVVIGQDGLVANTLKYLNGQPVIGINPDPERWGGKLLPFEIGQLTDILTKTEAQKVAVETVTFAEAKTNDGQTLLAVNDIFIGRKTHSSAHYQVSWNGRTERQSSSGIIVSTGFGSTGWFQSVLAGAKGVLQQSSHPLERGFAWSEERLHFAVREPFPSNTTGTDIVFGEVSNSKPLKIESLMPENGVVFSDGIEEDFLNFNSGCMLSVNIANTRGLLVTT
ncbi:MAG: sugar kinase [Gammaproteobacteria bacterium]|nr:sugar kinase [Gammaproteobacteria bacterium]